MQGKRVLAIAALTVATTAAGVAPAHASLAYTMVAKMNAQRARGVGPLRMSAHMNRALCGRAS